MNGAFATGGSMDYGRMEMHASTLAYLTSGLMVDW